jgi:hypothetical protein
MRFSPPPCNLKAKSIVAVFLCSFILYAQEDYDSEWEFKRDIYFNTSAAGISYDV